MASENSISALPAPAHPMANAGYGKRAAPGEPGQTRRSPDFGHLPPREAYVAAFVDRLPEGAAMDVKSLAKVLPLYGQQAVGSALNALSRAGHLRRVRQLAETGDTGTRWVFRTYWSRVARDDEWWTRFLTGDGAGGLDDPALPAAPASLRTGAPVPASDGAPGAPVPPPVATRSTAYQALAQLGRIEGRLTLSAADCAALADLAAPWFERGVTLDRFTCALTSGLPDVVHAPRALLGRRLRDKLPPEAAPDLTPAPASGPRPAPGRAHGLRRTIVECTECGVPGRPQALPGGLCRACAARGRPSGPSVTATADVAPDVRRHVSRIRAAIATRRGQVSASEPGLLFSR
ncbi:MarR family transcriptional regulator [Streptomyces sp. NPDC058305]|uniref:MarR family transcriptional regulator n=1 Tax=Streptomyces sp. NPDC058305 TaxID=3346438 RepID=UPI0036EA4639